LPRDRVRGDALPARQRGAEVATDRGREGLAVDATARARDSGPWLDALPGGQRASQGRGDHHAPREVQGAPAPAFDLAAIHRRPRSAGPGAARPDERRELRYGTRPW